VGGGEGGGKHVKGVQTGLVASNEDYGQGGGVGGHGGVPDHVYVPLAAKDAVVDLVAALVKQRLDGCERAEGNSSGRENEENEMR
jgi:hypothetical protein